MKMSIVVMDIEIPMVQTILREMQMTKHVNKIYIVQFHDLIVRRHVIVCLQYLRDVVTVSSNHQTVLDSTRSVMMATR